MPATIRQERPSSTAIVANRLIDATAVLVGTLIIALPFFMMVKEIGIAFVFLAILGASLILIRMLLDLLQREYSLYRLEPDQLIVDRGIISHQRIVVPLNATRIQNVAAQQPFLGRLVGYGHVLVYTAGWGVVRLRYVSNPYVWQEDILRQLQATANRPSRASSVQASGGLPTLQIASTGMRRSVLILSGLFTLVCVCILLFSAGSVAISKPTPTPTPAPGVIIFPSITGSDMLSSLWWLYQIPLIFWSVNAIIIASVAMFILETIGRRRR